MADARNAPVGLAANSNLNLNSLSFHLIRLRFGALSLAPFLCRSMDARKKLAELKEPVPTVTKAEMDRRMSDARRKLVDAHRWIVDLLRDSYEEYHLHETIYLLMQDTGLPPRGFKTLDEYAVVVSALKDRWNRMRKLQKSWDEARGFVLDASNSLSTKEEMVHEIWTYALDFKHQSFSFGDI